MTQAESMLPDARVVLGGGIDQEGRLSEVSLSRIEYAADLYKHRPLPLILSGRWSLLVTDPPRATEAAAMRDFARGQGVAEDDMLAEGESMDTIGNAYFTKLRYLEPRRWRIIELITSASHCERAVYVFCKVLGDDYTIRPISVPESLSDTERLAVKARERTLLTFTKSLLESVKAGDMKAVHTVLQQLPGYGPSPRYTKDDLMQLLEGGGASGSGSKKSDRPR